MDPQRHQPLRDRATITDPPITSKYYGSRHIIAVPLPIFIATQHVETDHVRCSWNYTITKQVEVLVGFTKPSRRSVVRLKHPVLGSRINSITNPRVSKSPRAQQRALGLVHEAEGIHSLPIGSGAERSKVGSSSPRRFANWRGSTRVNNEARDAAKRNTSHCGRTQLFDHCLGLLGFDSQRAVHIDLDRSQLVVGRPSVQPFLRWRLGSSAVRSYRTGKSCRASCAARTRRLSLTARA